MKEAQTQLQELESTIRQRKLYLQGQANQIQQNQAALQQQKQQLEQNEAILKAQKLKIESLSKDRTEVLEQLRREAEKTPSDRYRRLVRRCSELATKIDDLTQKKLRLETALEQDSDHLGELDELVIELDAKHNFLEKKVNKAKERLKRSERSAEFQSAVVMNLQRDIEKMQLELKVQQDNKITLEKEQESLIKDIGKKTQILKSLEGTINDKELELKNLNVRLTDVTKSLKRLNTKDSNFRRNLAEEKLKIERDKENVKAAKQALKKEEMAKRQLQPKWKPKTTDEPQHFKI